jgi:hypothetical protein
MATSNPFAPWPRVPSTSVVDTLLYGISGAKAQSTETLS